MRRDEWDWAPNRQEVHARSPEVPKHRSRKDRKRWCGGHIGREHVPVIRMSKLGLYWLAQRPDKPVCGWLEQHHWEVSVLGRAWVGTGEWKWRCQHEEGCDRCGKILGGLLGVGKRCPDFKERTTPPPR